MTGLSVLGSRLASTLTTPDDTDDTAGVDAFNSTIRHRPDAVVRAAAEADVVETVRLARAEGMPLQLHATGQRTTAPSGHHGRHH
jgi:FAD/FMN-containing dehydrogenase